MKATMKAILFASIVVLAITATQTACDQEQVQAQPKPQPPPPVKVVHHFEPAPNAPGLAIEYCHRTDV